MKQSVCGEKARLYAFTDSLWELVSSGISLQKSLELMKKSCAKDAKVRENSGFLLKSLLDGVQFSLALEMSPAIHFPDWYCAFIGISEECGNLPHVLFYLKNFLKKEKMKHEKIVSALVYPVTVFLLTVIAGFLSVCYVLPSGSLIFENADEIKAEAIRMMLLADIGMFCAFILIFLSVKHALLENPCTRIFRAMAFLSREHVPTLSAVSCVFRFASQDKKSAAALLSAKSSLLNGSHLSECFGSCFEQSGFKAEGLLLSENLSLDEATGNNSGFEKTVSVLESRQEKREKLVLSLLQPALLCSVAVYITLILKTAFLPYLTNFGGFV